VVVEDDEEPESEKRALAGHWDQFHAHRLSHLLTKLSDPPTARASCGRVHERHVAGSDGEAWHVWQPIERATKRHLLENGRNKQTMTSDPTRKWSKRAAQLGADQMMWREKRTRKRGGSEEKNDPVKIREKW
jgi:hypothetical protein